LALYDDSLETTLKKIISMRYNRAQHILLESVPSYSDLSQHNLVAQNIVVFWSLMRIVHKKF